MRFINYRNDTDLTDDAVFFVDECASPAVTAQSVLVKVLAFGVNRADTLQRQGKYPAPAGESNILGLEIAGEIVAVGEQVERWQLGDKVCGLVGGGGYAEYALLDAHQAIAVPKNIPIEHAAGLPEVFLTAFQSLFTLANLGPQENVLIHAGASGVGLAAIQLASVSGCHVAVTCSSDNKLQRCQAAGARHLINYTQTDFASELQKLNFSADVILDFVGGDYLNRNLTVAGVDARIVYLAMLAGRYADKLDLAKLLSKRITLIGSTLRNRDVEYKRALVAAFCDRFYADLVNVNLRVNIDSVYTAKEVVQTHRRLENNDSAGKLICCW